MKALALIGSLVALIVAVVYMTKSVESVTPDSTNAESVANLPSVATDVAADANSNVQAMENAIRKAGD
ncbi:MAG: hypothetical protein O3C21_01355 [Verrucomicrobia bacterium]|nr:hypothetical protein [Verrucomicrobiota bacterium]